MGKLINADDIVKVAKHAYHEWCLGMGAAENNRQVNKCYKMQELCKAVQAVAEGAPAVDAVPVTRCKDCKHYSQTLTGPSGFGSCHYCIYPTPDDFCSRGEPVDNPVENVNNSGGVNNG